MSSVVSAVKLTIATLKIEGEIVNRRVGPWALQREGMTNMTEIHGLHIIIPNAQKAARFHNYVSRGQVLELFDLLGGENPGFLHHLWPFYRQWLNRNGKYPYAYGERLSGLPFEINQWETVVYLLRQDPTTRHAYLVIRRPNDIVETYQPCSIGCHFQTNSDGALDMHWYIRSNDVAVGGLARNLFINLHIFGQMCQATGLKMGTYYHYSDNTHMYESDELKVQNLADTIVPCPFNSSDLETYFTTKEKSEIHDLLASYFIYGESFESISKYIEPAYYRALLGFVMKVPDYSIPEIKWLEEQADK